MKHIFYDCIWRNDDLGFFCVVVCKNPSGWEWLHCPILRRLFEAWRVGERFLFALWWSRAEIFGLLWSRIWTRCSLAFSHVLVPHIEELASVSKQVIYARCACQREYPKLVLIPPDSGSDEKHPQSLHSLASYLQLQPGWSDWLQRLHQGKVQRFGHHGFFRKRCVFPSWIREYSRTCRWKGHYSTVLAVSERQLSSHGQLVHRLWVQAETQSCFQWRQLWFVQWC